MAILDVLIWWQTQNAFKSEVCDPVSMIEVYYPGTGPAQTLIIINNSISSLLRDYHP